MTVTIPWVVKLGGSLALSPALPCWLEALAECPAVIVPGGGLFADAVRVVQQRWGFDDGLAHTLAITAMSQYGRMLQGLCPRLAVAGDPAALRRLVARGKTVIWLPQADQVAADARVQASWEVTSDSLAAWLTGQLGVGRLLLVKSATPPQGPCAVRSLVASGLIDPAFPELTAGGSLDIWLCGPERHTALRTSLEQPGRSFTQVIPLSMSHSLVRRPP